MTAVFARRGRRGEGGAAENVELDVRPTADRALAVAHWPYFTTDTYPAPAT
ncbi:MAG TPA: hypothetical protein VND62_04070 [Acidimicrobiales bacterium]|nr:hypothetical protein [Acidimicrobiales bacterium]